MPVPAFMAGSGMDSSLNFLEIQSNDFDQI